MSYDLVKIFIEESSVVEKSVSFSKNSVLLRYTGEDTGDIELDKKTSEKIEYLNSISYIDEFIKSAKKSSEENPEVKKNNKEFNVISDKITKILSGLIFRRSNRLYSELCYINFYVKSGDLLTIKKAVCTVDSKMSKMEKIKSGDARFDVTTDGLIEFPEGGELIVLRWRRIEGFS